MPTDAADPEPRTDLVIRPANPGELGAVADLYLAARAAAPMPPPVHDDEAVRAWLGHLPERHEVWVAADEDDRLAGFAAWDDRWLDSLYVHPERQGQGVGSALLEVVKSQRPDGFGLWVFVSNRPARDFYAHHGLVELEHTDGSTNEERAPDVRMAWLGERPLAYLRSRIDAVDDELAVLLARRAALTGAVQDQKEVGGHAGRDAAREAEIVERMARHVPGLGRDRIAAVMRTVIAESLAAWEERSGDGGGFPG